MIEEYDLEGRSLDVSSGFTRKTTTIRLVGGDEEGLGEDVTYEADEHDAQLARGPVLPLVGDWTLGSFSRHLSTVPLFEREPDRREYLDYRRWAFESAALDLALRQAGRSLAATVGRALRPLTFVVSMRLGSPPALDRVRGWMELYPGGASSSTPRATGRTTSLPRFGRSAASTRSTSRSLQGRSSTKRPIRPSISASSKGSPGSGSRIPRSTTARDRSSKRSRPRSPGTP